MHQYLLHTVFCLIYSLINFNSLWVYKNCHVLFFHITKPIYSSGTHSVNPNVKSTLRHTIAFIEKKLAFVFCIVSSQWQQYRFLHMWNISRINYHYVPKHFYQCSSHDNAHSGGHVFDAITQELLLIDGLGQNMGDWWVGHKKHADTTYDQTAPFPATENMGTVDVHGAKPPNPWTLL